MSKENNCNNLTFYVPKELQDTRNWVVHKNKIPLHCDRLRAVSASDKENWFDFETAVTVYRNEEVDGVGFCFEPPFIGVDIDKSLDLTIPKKLQSYTEYSPSGKGLHILGKGSIPSAYKTQGLEIYNRGRFFTVTGNVVPGFPKALNDLTATLHSYFVNKNTPSTNKGNDWMSEVLGNLRPGNLHDSAVKLIGKLHRNRVDKEAIRAMLWSHFKSAGCEEIHFDECLDSVTRYKQPMSEKGVQIYDEPEEHKPIELITPESHYREYQRNLLNPASRADSELPTGIPSLDRYTSGLTKGRIWVVGARTNTGKTSFSITIAEALLKRNRRVLFFSTEMDYTEIFDRFISFGTEIPLFSFTEKRFSEAAKRAIAGHRLSFESQNLFVFDGAEPNLREVDEAISRIRPDVLIFDHIQRVANQSNQRALELARFVKGVNTLCRKYKVAGLLNSQLNRVAASERPQLHHLKECGALEEEAKSVILLSWLDEQAGIVMADLAKNKGPKGEVQLKFNKTLCKFEEV